MHNSAIIPSYFIVVVFDRDVEVEFCNFVAPAPTSVCLTKPLLRTTHPSIQLDCYKKYRAILLLSIDVSTHSIKTSLLSDTRHTVAHLKESTTCIRLLQAKCALPSSTPQPPLQASSAPNHKLCKKIAVITPTDMKAILPRVLLMGEFGLSHSWTFCRFFQSHTLRHLHLLLLLLLHHSFEYLSYAFGMGGLEKTAYDSKEKIFYGVSEQGIVSSENW